MKILIEMEAEDALELCTIHSVMMEVAVMNIGRDPIAYSSMSRVTNVFVNEVIKKMPPDEMERISNKMPKEQ
jgi:hypothetical protein